MIVTTDLGLRYEVQELECATFRVRLLNPEDQPALNPWSQRPVPAYREDDVLSSFSVWLGMPFVFHVSGTRQVLPSELWARGLPEHNHVVRIDP